MTNKTLLQRLCEQVNVERPTNLASLTVEQQQMLRFLDEQQIEICGKKDWWFLQRTGDLSLWPYASGSSAAMTGTTTRTITITGATPFHATLTNNGRMTMVGSDFVTDVMRVTYATTASVTLPAGATARTNPTGVAWVYGQSEYSLATDCDRVSWVIHWRSGTSSVSHRVLTGISEDEMENIRCNRALYITAGQPINYCVLKTGLTSDHIRRIAFDPFPEFASNVTYGYFVKPTTLYNTSDVTPVLPPKYEQLLLDKAAIQYYSAPGMGAPAGSPAGSDLKGRIEETMRDVQEAEGQMMGDQKEAQELAHMDSSGMTRMFFSENFGRSI
jgi:hypothetical protein